MKKILNLCIIIGFLAIIVVFTGCDEEPPVPVITINSQPAEVTNVTVRGINGILTVNASVTAGAKLSYQWYSNPIQSNSGGTAVSGAVNADFAIPTGLAIGTYYYFCEVSASDGAASVCSNVATVTVGLPVITINTQPAAETHVSFGNINENLTIEASVTGNETLSYQWYSNNANNNTSGTALPGAATARFDIFHDLSAGTYYYFCEVSASGGAASVRSNIAVVTVSRPVITINTHPATATSVITGSINESLIVEASVTENGTLSYQWFSNIVNNNTSGTALPCAATARYDLLQNLSAGTYYYFCEVSASGGAASVRSNVATVTVGLPVITINTQPVATTSVTAGKISESLIIEASVTGSGTISYQWYSNTANNNTSGTALAGAATARYDLLQNLSVGTYYYFCEVSASGGAASVRSNVAMVTVNPHITINTHPVETTNFTCGNISGNLTISASVIGGAALRYQWYLNTENNNTEGTRINGATNASFTIPTTLSDGTYYYFCEISAAGTTGGTASVRSNVATVSVVDYLPVEMVWVPGGSFELGREIGTAGSGDVTPVSTVTLTGFYIGKYEVMQAQYYSVMGSNPSNFSSNPVVGEIQGRRPVELVSWYDAIVFCNRLSMKEGLTPAYSINGSTNPTNWGSVPTSSSAVWNNVEIVSDSTGYRLPTEAQWEYAAKGGNGSPGNFTFAGSNNVNDVAWHSGNSGSRTHAVGLKQPNGLGIYDMSGNVSEWCWDWRWDYTSEAKTNPVGAASGSYRVRRGGGWNGDGQNLRSAYRDYGDPFYRGYNIGFRLLRP